MNAATEFDLGPLTWVKGEIDLALERASEALGQHELSGDTTQLRFCRTHVHQVHGALAIVGLDGVTQVTESLEALLSALEERRLQLTSEISATLAQSLAAIRKYLDDLVAGEPNQPLRLLPAYGALAAARGQTCSASDLFHPDLSLRAPRRSVPVAPLSAEQLHTLLKSERARFQRGLLAWLQHTGEPHVALENMRAALDNIEATQEAPAARSFWWAALAFIESLFDRQGDAVPDSRQLLARIDTQIRRLLEGSHGVAERLMRDVLYAVAQAPASASMLVAEVQSVFGLPALMPAAATEQQASQPQEIALRRLRDTLAATEELWNKFCSGSASALSAFDQHAQSCAALTNEIGHTDLKRLGQGFAALAAWLAEDSRRHNDAVAMEVATAILLLQNAQENFHRLGMDFAQQVDLMVARLYACIAGKPAGGNDELPLLDEMTRRAQEKLLVGQVAREIQNNLAQVEQALDGFFRNPEKGQDLAALDAPLKQIAGALTMLGHFSAVTLVQDCGGRIQAFARPGYTPAAEDFEAVAQQLSLLGFFVDALQHGETDYDAFVRRLQGGQPEGGEQAVAEEAAATGVAEPLEPFVPEVSPLFAGLAEVPQVPVPVQDVGQDLPFGEMTDTVITGFDIGGGEEAWQPASETPVALPLAAEAAPSAETVELAQSSHAEIDAELLSIFLEEAHEVLVTVSEQAALLAGDHNNVEALTTIRRSAHTLKGSGRMVGLTEMGETAWALEQTLNMWLRQDMAVTPDLLALIADAHALFSRWVAALEQGSGAIPDSTALVAKAELLRSQEATPAVQALDAAPLATPPVQEVELPVAVADEAPSAVIDLPPEPVWETPEQVAAVPAEAPLPMADEFLFDLSAEPELVAETAQPPEIFEQPAAPPPWEDTTQAFAELPVPEVEELRSTPEIVEIPPAPPAPTLYDIFCDEARGHLQTLLATYAALEADPLAPTLFDMTRAAHTLGGIAATVGLMPLNRLAIALEHALLRRDSSGRPDSIEGLETVRQAIITLDAMFAGLARQEAPEEQVQLISALEDVFVTVSVPEVVQPELEPEFVQFEPEPEFVVEEVAPQPEPAATVETVVQAPQPAVPRLQDELDEQLLPIFLEEAQDQLRELTVQLRLWRGDLGSDAQPHAIARLLHTFKGNARMAGAMNLGEFTHHLEARVEDILRAGSATPAFIDEIEGGCDTLAQATERLRHGESAIPEPVAAVAPGETPAAVAPTVAVPLEIERDHDAEAGAHRATLRVRADLIDRLVNEAGELSIARARIEGEMRSLKGSLLDLTENVIRLRRQLREIEIQAEGQIQARVAQAHEGHADFDPLELDRFTRFQELTRFMAESVNDVATVQQNLLKNLDDANAAIVAQARLNRGLQQELMGVRMMPFASQAERLFRIVRQSAKELGKRTNFDIVGGQVELDRSVLDKMMAPLEHMLRNAVAHGIEPRAERQTAGKPEIGDITVSLAQEGNEIILSMADDGRGLDGQRIRARAEAMGLLAPGEAADEAVLYDMIFRPGFSTAGEVSQLAGRGVGMDVVKTEVAELGGRIEILSQPGHGTTFRLYLPLTLAVTQTLLLRVGSQMYAVPSTMIEQVLELKEEQLADVRQRGEAEWMGNRYPFHFLPHLLGDTGAAPEAQRRYWILLLRSGSQRVAVQVDELRGNQEVVVKNIGAQLSRVVGIAGATVLGDGQVVLILNPVALASRIPVVSVQSEAPVFAEPVATAAASLPTVMVVDDSLTVRKITSRLLTREGYQVVLAKDGVDALEQLLEVVPDVVLSDIEMPRMDGFDLVRNIRADKRLSGLPVIMITSRTAEKHRNHALEVGASDYLGKPYDEDQLLALIAGYVKARALA
ncbi:Hpt domain-containing protein [Dechloromonas sp. H13]|uniref:Hpt domain-containing protein n=1 Tax=Dechloromonas sp. H13 TaxID=2570193 RepID=UPI0012927223|nr:Hpt domain-containing protein [Dechloromonas sp. H13]